MLARAFLGMGGGKGTRSLHSPWYLYAQLRLSVGVTVRAENIRA